MQQIRAKYPDDAIPEGYEGRTDFVIWSEMVETGQMLEERYGFKFDDIIVYYKMRV